MFYFLKVYRTEIEPIRN